MRFFDDLRIILRLVKDIFGLLREKFLRIRRKYLSRRNKVFAYFCRLRELASEAAFLVLAVWAALLALLYAAGLLWHLYLQTITGREFRICFPEKTALIEQVFDSSLFLLSGRVTLSVFLVCAAAASIARITHISRYFYMSLGIIGKLLYWGPALTAASAFYLHEQYAGFSWKMSVLFAVIPAYCLFMNCFKYAERLLPEAEDVVSLAVPFFRRAWKSLRRIAEKISEKIEQ